MLWHSYLTTTTNEIYFLQNHVALCTLHSNALYVKLFFVIYFWNSFLVLITLFGLLYSVLTSMLYVRALTLCMGTKLKWERMMILASKLGVWIIWYCIYTYKELNNFSFLTGCSWPWWRKTLNRLYLKILYWTWKKEMNLFLDYHIKYIWYSLKTVLYH